MLCRCDREIEGPPSEGREKQRMAMCHWVLSSLLPTHKTPTNDADLSCAAWSSRASQVLLLSLTYSIAFLSLPSPQEEQDAHNITLYLIVYETISLPRPSSSAIESRRHGVLPPSLRCSGTSCCPISGTRSLP